MNVHLIAFTQNGMVQGEKIAAALSAEGAAATLFCGTGKHKTPLAQFAENGFQHANALIFIGAAGIAVRAIAPFVRSKASDPAVLCMDDGAHFCISLLSGHLGGANALCARVADITGAQAVITTATDTHGVFAVDTWAASQGLFVANPAAIKLVSAKLLRGETVSIAAEISLHGALPQGVELSSEKPDIIITAHAAVPPHVLHLVPKTAVLGIGCKKGTSQAAIEAFFTAFAQKNNLHAAAVFKVCSIDLKQNEQGLLDFCAAHGYRFETYTAAQLAAVQGDFSPSAFVQSITGVDNVCERSAVLGANGALTIKKNAGGGVTMALATHTVCACFEENI